MAHASIETKSINISFMVLPGIFAIVELILDAVHMQERFSHGDPWVNVLVLGIDVPDSSWLLLDGRLDRSAADPAAASTSRPSSAAISNRAVRENVYRICCTCCIALFSCWQ